MIIFYYNLGEHEETIEDINVTNEIIESEETLEDIKLKQKPKSPPAETSEEKPTEKIVLKLNDLYVKKHEEACFELKLPKKSDVKWSKDGEPISADAKFTIEVKLKKKNSNQ